MFTRCPLSYLLGTEHLQVDALPAGPFAIRGTAVHEVIEKFIGMDDVPGAMIKSAVCESLKRLIDTASTSSLMKWVYERHGLDGIFSRQYLVDVCAFVKQTIKDYPNPRQTSSGGTGKALTGGNLSKLGTEKWFHSERFDLAGRVDLTFREGNDSIHVVDYKTGQILDDDGEPKDDFILQVAAYGVVVKEILGVGTIVLELVGPKTKWRGELDPHLEGRVESLVNRIKSELPRGELLDRERLAVVGRHCQTCSYRPACKNYLQIIRNGPSETAVGAISDFDITGSLLKINSAGDLVDLRALTPDGRTISINSVPLVLVPRSTEVGCEISAFGLGSLEIPGRARVPGNFYVFKRDDPKKSAFNSMLIFRK